MSFALTGIGLVTPLGRGPTSNRRTLLQQPPQATSLAEIFGADHPLAHHVCRPLCAEIRQRLGKGVLAPASNLALMLARDCLADAGRRYDEIQNARTGLFIASSRGNLAGWLDPWPGRRARGPLSVSNSSHAELTSAVQRELKIEGPVHLSADGCAAGLSALGLAHSYLKAGEIDRALVIAVDLPLTPSVLGAYAKSGILGSGSNHPFADYADGMIPAEGGAAILIERNPPGGSTHHPSLENALVRHEARHLLHFDPTAAKLVGWIHATLAKRTDPLGELLISPHASGTQSNRRTEQALLCALDRDPATPGLNLTNFRPWTGHAIGATGLIDLALAVHVLRNGSLPQTVEKSRDLSDPQFIAPKTHQGATLINWSLGIGGQFAACLIEAPRQLPSAHRLSFSVGKGELTVSASEGTILATLPCSSAAKGIGFAEGSHQTPIGRFRIAEKYGHAAAERTVFKSRRPEAPWTDEDDRGTKVTHGILRLEGLDPDNANTWDRYVYIHGTNQLIYPPENRSHGCLTLAEADFRTLFQLVPEDATLIVEA